MEIIIVKYFNVLSALLESDFPLNTISMVGRTGRILYEIF